jgi:hypothetical protein
VNGLGSNPFRSPLLGVSLLLSLPPGTEMFQFPGFPPPTLCVQAGVTGHDPSWVSPFGHRWICGWLAPPQRLSQLPTSFFGSRCQGIHRVPLTACRKDRSRSLWSSQRTHTTRTDRPTPTKQDGPDRHERCVQGAIPSELHRVPNTTARPQDRSHPPKRAPRSDRLHGDTD